MKPDVYKFRIDNFTPHTLPMGRLAAYMTELAKLFGHEPLVHFREIKGGSAVLVTEVESVAIPKVRERLVRVEGAASNWRDHEETSGPFHKLNSMLADDNAVGDLSRAAATVLAFPGRQSARVRIGPVTQPTSLIGQLVRIGGRDKTSHAQIEDAEGRVWPLVMTRDQARALAPLIYGEMLRFTGTGRWARTEDGLWELDELRLQFWEALQNESLRESIDAMRLIEASTLQMQGNPLAVLEHIRHGA